jgi:CxxC motif-containing protein (DUF1111 family)
MGSRSQSFPRYAAGVALLSALAAGCTGSKPSTADLLSPSSGGGTTVHDDTRNAYSMPAANLDVQQRAQFFIGNAFFNSPWVAAPASAAARDGLGPLFNARSCDACHNNDGRGQPPKDGERPVSMVIQFATPIPGDHDAPGADPRYGANLNPFAINGVPAEGTVRIVLHDLPGQFADGAEFVLHAPEYLFEQLAYGDLANDTSFSPRVAPSVFGSGLLEAVPEEQILEYADPDDRDRNGISGRPNHVWDHRQNRVVLGRFGWKSNQPDIAHQTSAAFSAEIGMSSTLKPVQNCMPEQKACLDAPTGGSPELSDEIFDHIVRYQQMLAVPERRNLDSSATKRGAELFASAQCAACHRPTLVTGQVPGDAWRSGQTIHPFTDLLLHDMGPALADHRPDFEASGTEWRTPPLWGLGLLQKVNRHTRLLHDGRARDVTEAILWHGGEADASKHAFMAMSASDRAALLAFLESL